MADGSASIENWLRSKGHKVERQGDTFEQRSCLTKKRYSIEPSCTMTDYAYRCGFCSGWHKATRRDRSE